MLGSSLFPFRMASSQKPCYFEALLSWQWGFERAHPCLHKSCTETNGERLERGEAIGTPRLVWPLVPLRSNRLVAATDLHVASRNLTRWYLKFSTRWWFWHHRHFFQSQAVCGWWERVRTLQFFTPKNHPFQTKNPNCEWDALWSHGKTSPEGLLVLKNLRVIHFTRQILGHPNSAPQMHRPKLTLQWFPSSLFGEATSPNFTSLISLEAVGNL